MPIVTLVLLIVMVALLLVLLVKTSKVGSPMLDSRLDAFEKAQERTERCDVTRRGHSFSPIPSRRATDTPSLR